MRSDRTAFDDLTTGTITAHSEIQSLTMHTHAHVHRPIPTDTFTFTLLFHHASILCMRTFHDLEIQTSLYAIDF